ncbi:NUDIX domain-containing protein [Patescibacteria group bacterium]|nr:NUDIX domain-containing protein [Patescibacteria group bacterium]
MSERHVTRTAVFIVLEKDGKIFMLRRANTGWSDGLLTVPAGHVDKGDFVIESAIKEAKEEAGVSINPEDLEFLHVDFIRDEYVNFYFKATKWEGEPGVGEPEMASEGIWCDLANLPDDIVPPIQNLFVQIKQGKAFSEYSR